MRKDYLVPANIKVFLEHCLKPQSNFGGIESILIYDRKNYDPMVTKTEYINNMFGHEHTESYEDYCKHKAYYKALFELKEAMLTLQKIIKEDRE